MPGMGQSNGPGGFTSSRAGAAPGAGGPGGFTSPNGGGNNMNNQFSSSNTNREGFRNNMNENSNQRSPQEDNNPFGKVASFFNKDSQFTGSRSEERQLNSAFNNFMENEGPRSNVERNEVKKAFGGLFSGFFGGGDDDYQESVDPYDSYSGRPSQRNNNDFGSSRQATSRQSFP